MQLIWRIITQQYRDLNGLESSIRAYKPEFCQKSSILMSQVINQYGTDIYTNKLRKAIFIWPYINLLLSSHFFLNVIKM